LDKLSKGDKTTRFRKIGNGNELLILKEKGTGNKRGGIWGIYENGGKGKIQYTQQMPSKVFILGFRKVTKKGAFPNETALLKLPYLQLTELKINGKLCLFPINQCS
jgi:hypothetical protein